MAENLSTTLADDAKAHAINLLRIEAGMRMEVVGMLDALEKDLVKQLASTDLTTAKKERLQAFLDQTTAQVSSAYKQINDVGAANLEKVATISSKQVAKSLNAGLGVDIGTVLSPQQLTAIAKGPIVEGSLMADWWAGQDMAAQRRFKGAIQQGLLLGEDMASIQRRVRGTKASGFTDGALAVSKREAAALTRTAVQSVNNQARIETLMENGDVVKGIEWVATLDARTTKICMALSGKQWRLPDLKPIGHDKVFPGAVAHWGERSTQGPVTYSWAELAGKKLKAKEGKPTFEEAFQKRLEQQGFTPEEAATIKAKQRASMDGQVSDSKDWEAWLKGKGDAFALEKLGPGRFALWKQGKLTLSDLTDQQGRELTLAELEAAIDGGTIPPETEGRDFKPANAAAAYNAAQEDAAKVAVLQQQQAEAAAKLADYKATKEGQTLKNKWALKVDGELGTAPETEKVAWVEAKAAEEQAAKSKASVLSSAKEELVAGDATTPEQQKVIDSLTPEEKRNFDEAVADAIEVKKLRKQIEEVGLPDGTISLFAKKTKAELRADAFEEKARLFAQGKTSVPEDIRKLTKGATADEEQRLLARIAEIKSGPTVVEKTPTELMAEAAQKPLPARNSPVSGKLDLSDFSDSAEVAHGLRVMDSVLDDGALSKIKVTSMRENANDAGSYNYKTFTPLDIGIGNRKNSVLTMLHETAHFLDHKGFGTDGVGFASIESPLFAGYRDVLEKSPTHRALLRDLSAAKPADVRAHLRYLSDPRESFARAFSQYVTEKSGDPLALRQLALDRRSEYGPVMYFTPDEMLAFAPEFDKILATLKLL